MIRLWRFEFFDIYHIPSKLLLERFSNLMFSSSHFVFSLQQRHVGLGGEGQYVGDKTSAQERCDLIEEEEMLDACEEQHSVQDLFPLSHKMAREMGVKPDKLQVNPYYKSCFTLSTAYVE